MELETSMDVGGDSIASAMEGLKQATTTASTEAAPQSAASEAPATSEAAPAQSADAATPAAAAPAAPYVPTYKYKVKDKELEFDEFLRGAIKTPEQEAKARELYEKAMGLEEVKAHREEIRNKFKSYQESNEPIINTVKQAGSYYQAADQALKSGNGPLFVKHAESFFQKLGVPPQVLLQYAHHYFQMQDSTPEQKAQYNMQYQLTQQAQAQQSQLAQEQQRAQELENRLHQIEISSALQRPEISSVQQAYEQKFGQGSFIKAMAEKGQYYWLSQKRHTSPSEVAQELAQQFGHLVSQAPSAPAPSQASASTSSQAPVIPVAKGGSASPVAKAPESLADLEQMYQQKAYGNRRG